MDKRSGTQTRTRGRTEELVTIRNSHRGQERKQLSGSRRIRHSKGPEKKASPKPGLLSKYHAEGPGG